MTDRTPRETEGADPVLGDLARLADGIERCDYPGRAWTRGGNKRPARRLLRYAGMAAAAVLAILALTLEPPPCPHCGQDHPELAHPEPQFRDGSSVHPEGRPTSRPTTRPGSRGKVLAALASFDPQAGAGATWEFPTITISPSEVFRDGFEMKIPSVGFPSFDNTSKERNENNDNQSLESNPDRRTDRRRRSDVRSC